MAKRFRVNSSFDNVKDGFDNEKKKEYSSDYSNFQEFSKKNRLEKRNCRETLSKSTSISKWMEPRFPFVTWAFTCWWKITLILWSFFIFLFKKRDLHDDDWGSSSRLESPWFRQKSKMRLRASNSITDFFETATHWF